SPAVDVVAAAAPPAEIGAASSAPRRPASAARGLVRLTTSVPGDSATGVGQWRPPGGRGRHCPAAAGGIRGATARRLTAVQSRLPPVASRPSPLLELRGSVAGRRE